MNGEAKRRIVLPAVVAIGVALCGPATSAAEVVTTSQARASAAEFLATAAPPATVGAICVVDTGVDLTPDTGGVQARISLYDDAVGDTSPTRHGTLVATLIAAPRNEWGMVGIWPSARIVSIRANTSGADEFTVASYYQGMQRCDGLAGYYGIKVVLLALGSSAALSEEEKAALNDKIASARSHGLSVVVAGGNNSGGALETPAQLSGALSVGGSGADGGRCAISAVGARVQAPGCGLDGIDPTSGVPMAFQGTTGSAAIVAAVTAALRSYRPDLAPDAADQLLVSTATPAAGGPLVNAAAAFRAAGLGAIVDAAVPVGAPPPAPVPSVVDPDRRDLAPPPDRLPRPSARVRRDPRRPGRLVVTFRNLPRRVNADVRVSVRNRGSRKLHTVARRRTHARSVSLRVPSRSGLRVTIGYVDPTRARVASRALIVRVSTVGRSRR